jgi:hypothetical protein
VSASAVSFENLLNSSISQVIVHGSNLHKLIFQTISFSTQSFFAKLFIDVQALFKKSSIDFNHVLSDSFAVTTKALKNNHKFLTITQKF